MPTALAPIARFCGEIILPSTPPELLAAASRVGESPVWCPAVTWSRPKSEFDEVSEPLTATPSQPRIEDRKAKKPPAPAISLPRVISQLALKVTDDGALPALLTTHRPGQANLTVTESSALLIGPIWARPKTMMITA